MYKDPFVRLLLSPEKRLIRHLTIILLLAVLVYAGVASGDTGYANGYLNFNRWGSWQYSSRTSALNAADGNSIADILLGAPGATTDPQGQFERLNRVYVILGATELNNQTKIETASLQQDITFKPYACGTMIHPYIDCMIRLAEQGVAADDIAAIECETGEGLVDRLWEPLAAKHRPPSGYAAKFSMPFGMAVGFFDRAAGLEQFTDEKAHDPRILALAGRIRYIIDPANEYPANYTGHIRVSLRNGHTIELRQPHMRGGKREPLSRDELVRKFHGNALYGGWAEADAQRLLAFCLDIVRQPDLSGLSQFRI